MRIYQFPGSSGLGATIELSNRWLHFTIFEGIILLLKQEEVLM